jgi:hypothetical protein
MEGNNRDKCIHTGVTAGLMDSAHCSTFSTEHTISEAGCFLRCTSYCQSLPLVLIEPLLLHLNIEISSFQHNVPCLEYHMMHRIETQQY